MATHHELHVARAGRLGARRRYLLRQVRRRHDCNVEPMAHKYTILTLLRHAHAVVLEENDFEAPANVRVAVHNCIAHTYEVNK